VGCGASGGGWVDFYEFFDEFFVNEYFNQKQQMQQKRHIFSLTGKLKHKLMRINQ